MDLTQQIPVLDKGFVRYVDHMGSDSAIVQAARVSYGKGTKSVSEDEGLIRYLLRHHHTTPFEMCLHGDTKIYTYCINNRATQKFYTIQQIAEAFAEGGKENSWAKLLKIRTVFPNGKIGGTRVVRAWKTGKKDCFTVTEDSPLARKITVTDNHPFLTKNGYKNIREITQGDYIAMNGTVVDIETLWSEGKTCTQIAEHFGVSDVTIFRKLRALGIDTSRRKGLFKRKKDTEYLSHGGHAAQVVKPIVETSTCEVCGKKAYNIHHLDENSHNNVLSNLVYVCLGCHKAFHTNAQANEIYWRKVKSVEFVGTHAVYDLEVESRNHNFVANGFVVHNCEVKLHVKVPMDCWRQWIRHRTANVNEYSTRYSEAIDDKAAACGKWRLQSKSNKQGSAGFIEDTAVITSLDSDERELHNLAKEVYENRLTAGVAKEQARKDLPLSTYTEAYWKCDLHNLFNFLRLRMAPEAQLEIRTYANAIAEIVKELFPLSYAAFECYQLKTLQLSMRDIAVIQAVSRGDSEQALKFMGEFGWLDKEKPSREYKEFLQKLTNLGIAVPNF